MISIPQRAIVYIDTSAFIYAVERIDPYVNLLQPLWASSKQGHLPELVSAPSPLW